MDEPLQVADILMSTEEATETLVAIREGRVDAVVVNRDNGHAVLTFRDPDHAYRALVEAMGEGAALVSRDGVISYYNPRFSELTTRSGDAALHGRSLHDLVAADARVAIDSMLERALQGPARIEVGLLRSDGSTLPVQLTASPASVADVPVLCVIATDLSEQRVQAELYRKALIGMEERERLLSVAGHELRAPLQALVFDIAVALTQHRSPDEGATDPTMVERLESINRHVVRLANLVNSLLDVGLAGAERLPLAIEDVDLAEVVRDVIARSDDLARSGSLVTLELASVRGQWDRLRLEQVVTNLMSNAAKYGLGKPIRVVVDGDDRVARLAVEDNGIGIAPDAVARVFRPFERISSVKTATGLGLGLYITAQIVKAHGGVIHVESDLNIGSRFVIELPR